DLTAFYPMGSLKPCEVSEKGYRFCVPRHQCVGSLVGGLRRRAALQQQIDVELENPRRIQAQDFRALIFLELAHLSFDRLGGMRPGALGMGIVVGPHEVIYEVKTLG